MEEKKISKRKKAVFILLQLMLPFLFIFFIELVLRATGFGEDLSLFKQSKQQPGYYEMNRSVGKRFFSKLPATSVSNDYFLVEKPDSCYRIFILGGSSAQGFPYQSGASFGRILNYRLQDAFPDKLIEVVNLAMVATNSYTQVDFLEEVMKMKPDAILIYAGHNEYYGALGVGSVERGGNLRWMKFLNLRLVHLRTYQLLQRVIAKTFKAFSGDLTSNPTATLMEHIAQEKAIAYDSELYHAGVDQFQKNLETILRVSKRNQVPVMIGELVSNVRDIKPFKSIDTGQEPSADSVYQQACRYDSLGDYTMAHSLYDQAKDLDAIRFRAPEALNEVIHELGEKYSVPVVPIKKVFEQHSPNGIIGKELILEHLHPNIDGYFLLADGFFNAMRKEELIGSKWNSSGLKTASYYRKHWGFTALDSLVADLLVKKLLAGWPFQPDTVVNRFRFTYQPVSFVDSMAFMCLKYNNVSVFDQHIKMADYYKKANQFHEAFDEYYSLIKTDPFNTGLYFTAADLLLRSNEALKAAAVLNEIPAGKKNSKAYFKMGQAYQVANQTDQAISKLKQALRYSESVDEKEAALVMLYTIYQENGSSDRSREVLGELVKINPKHKALATQKHVNIVMASEQVKPLLDSAIVFAREGNLNEAYQILQRSLKIQETDFAYSMLGSIFFQKDKARALEYFNKAYALNPKDVNVLNNLCVLSVMKKDFALAEQYLNELKQVSDNAAQIQGLTGLIEKNKLQE